MKQIEESKNAARWPRCKSVKIDCRKRDLVIRVADWTRDKEEPAFDVETYVGGIYDFNLSKSFTTKSSGKTNAQAKAEAVAFASAQIAKLL